MRLYEDGYPLKTMRWSNTLCNGKANELLHKYKVVNLQIGALVNGASVNGASVNGIFCFRGAIFNCYTENFNKFEQVAIYNIFQNRSD